MRVFNLKCASCAAPLEINSETVEFVCAYCGSAQIVDRSGGAVTLKLVEESLGKIQHGTDRTAAELALTRLNSKLNTLYEELEGINEILYRVVEEPNYPRPKKGWFSFKTAEYGPRYDPVMHLWKIYDDRLKSQAETKHIWVENANKINQEIEEMRREIELNEAIVKRA